MLEELHTFVLFTEEGSIQKVAQRLPLTQPAVSRQIQRLEQSLGAVLLDRRQKPPALTPIGMAVLARGREILDSVTSLKTIAVTPEPSGVFRFGLVNGLASERLAERIASVVSRFPNVTLRLKSGWSSDLAEQHRLGLLEAVVLLADGSQPYEAERIGKEELVTVASRDLIARGDQQKISWILSPEPCDARRRLANRLGEKGQRMIVAAEIEDVSMQMGLVRQGLGVGLLPKRLLGETKPEGIEQVDIAGGDLKLDVLMVRSPHLGPMTKVVDGLVGEIRTLLAADGPS